MIPVTGNGFLRGNEVISIRGMPYISLRFITEMMERLHSEGVEHRYKLHDRIEHLSQITVMFVDHFLLYLKKNKISSLKKKNYIKAIIRERKNRAQMENVMLATLQIEFVVSYL